ncbi:MAG: hypothetical protein AAFZ65_13785 [Planctomycetota bacterium]
MEEADIEYEAPRAWRRLKAGLLVELGRADRKAAKRWQDAVVGGSFDADAAAEEILAASEVSDDDVGLVERAARLERDLLMQPKLRGASGAARGARKAGRNLLAYVFTQVLVLAFFALLFTGGLIVARYNEVEIDALLDRVVEHLPKPGASESP